MLGNSLRSLWSSTDRAVLQFLRGTRYEVLSCVPSEQTPSKEHQPRLEVGWVDCNLSCNSLISGSSWYTSSPSCKNRALSLITQPPPLQGKPTQRMQHIVKHFISQFSWLTGNSGTAGAEFWPFTASSVLHQAQSYSR